MRRREKLFWLCAGAALFALVFSLIPSHYEICEVGKKTKEEHCTTYQVVPYAAIKAGRFLDSISPAVTAIFTVVLGISTIGLWKATKLLWEAADATANAQERDTHILQRAYVSVEPMGLTLLIDGSHLLGLISVKNAGNLPARKLNWSIKMIASLNGELGTFPSFDTKGSIVVAPHSETTRGSDGTLSLSELLSMARAGENRLEETPTFIYVFGIVHYHDGFTDGRFTRFCHRYNYKVRPQVAGAAQYSMSRDLARQHTHGNEST